MFFVRGGEVEGGAAHLHTASKYQPSALTRGASFFWGGEGSVCVCVGGKRESVFLGGGAAEGEGGVAHVHTAKTTPARCVSTCWVH